MADRKIYSGDRAREDSVENIAKVLPQGVAGNIFEISGGAIELLSITGEVTTQIQAQANDTKISADPTIGAATDLCAVVEINGDVVGTFYNITGTLANAMVPTTAGVAIAQAGSIVIPAGVITVTCAASSTGNVTWRLRYKPLGENVSVAAV